MSGDDRFCAKCGAPLQAGSSFCPKCGASVSTSAAATGPNAQPADWRETRRQMRAQRRAERWGGQRSGIGPLIVATILIVAGLGIFFPSLPWQFFWGSLLVLFGVWIVALYYLRGRGSALQEPMQ
jgi:hypothetical protein